MSTSIEQTLFGGRGIHGVSEFTVSPDVVRLCFSPWEGPQIQTIALFSEARLKTMEIYPDDPSDLELPWDIYGFDGYELGNGRWRFVVHCNAIEFTFESAWPVISRVQP